MVATGGAAMFARRRDGRSVDKIGSSCLRPISTLYPVDISTLHISLLVYSSVSAPVIAQAVMGLLRAKAGFDSQTEPSDL